MNTRDIATGVALTIGIAGAVWAWADGVRDAAGRTATTSITAGDRNCEIMWLEELRIARL